MKRLLLLPTILLAFVCTATAQDLEDVQKPQTTAAVAYEAVQEGNWIVGANIGNIGFNFKSENFGIEVNPRAGYFISDNAAIGTEVQLGLSIYDGGEEFRYGLTPFVRYYFPEGAAPTHRWFGEALAGFAGSSLEDSEGDAVFSSVFGLRAGYAHFVSENVAIEGILGFTRTSADIDVGIGSSGLNLGIGFQIYLPGSGN
jgi:hypothetical protein